MRYPKLLLLFWPLVGLAPQQLQAASLDAALGKALFERHWVAAPASTDAADGLGPLFNAKSCVACHSGGGARLEEAGKLLRGGVVRLTDGAGKAHPYFGRQLQDQAIAGLAAEGRLFWSGDRLLPTMNEGVILPPFEVRLAPDLSTSSMIEGAAEEAIIALADPADRNADGISGRAHELVDGTIGRFGLKASHATLESQIADAFAFDLGLSSSRYPLPAGDCTVSQVTCFQAPTGESAALGGHELSDDMIALVASYLRALESRTRAISGTGSEVFTKAGCAACHQPALPAKDGSVLPLYSDLLLHDMGPESAGVVKEGDVAVTEWRTAPLVDLFVKGTSRRYMHDGRAATLVEAITAHHGEADNARRAYLALKQDEKNALVQFLEML